MNLQQLFRKKYFLLITRLNNPKEVVVEYLPVLLGKAILTIYQEHVEGQVDQIFGILGYSQECPLFVY